MSKKRKYNFAFLKAEFMASGYYDVKAFFKELYGNYTGTIRTQTTGWIVEKKERDKRIVERILKEKEDEKVAELQKALNNVVTFFKGKVKDQAALTKLTVKQGKIVWEVLRTENNLPTKITHNTNLNHDLNEEEEAYNALENESNNQSQDTENVKDSIEGEDDGNLPF